MRVTNTIESLRKCVTSQIQLSLYECVSYHTYNWSLHEWGRLGMRSTNVCHKYNWVCTNVCHVTHTIESLQMCVISQIKSKFLRMRQARYEIYECVSQIQLSLHECVTYHAYNWVPTNVCHVTHTTESLRMRVISHIYLSPYEWGRLGIRFTKM